ncbi:MAG: pectate lyase [Opitutae bacterium]|nr:pectate lyase [Opitutae bacterium]
MTSPIACRISFAALRFAALALILPLAARAVQRPPAVHEANGKLEYVVEANGDRVPDFSSAGYAGGGVALPLVPARLSVAPAEGDDGARIQAALDYVASLPADADGFRGAVQLLKGRYELSGRLTIRASGVVLRGGGDATVLVAVGTDRRALVSARGSAHREVGAAVNLKDRRVPVGARQLTVGNASGFRVGDAVAVSRPATPEWLHALGMDVAPARQQFAWRPAAMTLRWERTIVARDGGTLTLDAPITTALDATFDSATVAVVKSTGRLRKVGVENLRCESAFEASNPHDEQHAWEAVRFEHVEDGWIANVTAAHFAGSTFGIGAGCRRVTVQDCASIAPVSELGGYRRDTFHTSGEQTLFLRCRAEDGRNDFTVGYLAGGPNVFLECRAERSTGFSGSIGSWASGILFDNVTLDGGTLELNNRETWNQGVGWAAANSMLWQCSAPVVICRAPPTAQNWADGVWGQFVGDGYWSEVNEFVHPQSLYRAQLAARRGAAALAALAPRDYASVLTTRPLAEEISTLGPLLPRPAAGKPLALKESVLTVGGERLDGRECDIAWWRGFLLPGVEDTRPALTRFAPGKIGPIHTDDLDELTDRLAAEKQVVLRHHYGLWYDRRRMDHQRMRRADGDVWPPFYEQPFARSGKGAAWDGLSRYDLTRYNPWYFSRLREFAALARQKGLVLVNEMYFQHNILEAGAHWVDSPWRPTNNINGTHFTEPPPFDGDTVKMAAEFYDLTDPVYRALHRAYIRQCLANLADQPNVIHTLGAENSGPLHFMQFWLDVVAEWERETGKHPLIALSACKDVQDAILADPKRAAVVDVIDFTYWFRTAKGDEFAPTGGTDLAPRQHQRLWKKGRPSAASIAAMAAEYRAKFPGKAILTSLPEAGTVQP